MRTWKRPVAVGVLLGAAMLSGCRDNDAFSKCDQCGTIESVAPRVIKGKGSGAGAFAGAVIGGVVGHQFGSGRGNDAATVAGAAGGAVAGHEIEKQRKSATVFDVRVRMTNGELRHLTVPPDENLRPGDRVEVVDGRVVPLASKSS
jgi:outer membrane lipoprotein SlyB